MADLPPGFTLDAPAAGQPSSTLPAGFTVDPASLPAGFKLDSAPSDPGLAQRLGGIVGRGLVDGATGLIGTAQAAGRWVDNHLPSTSFEKKLDNLPVQQVASDAEDKADWYKPQQASGKILEGAVGGATGAALTGGVGALPLASSVVIGASQPTAKALGASDATADDIASGLSLLPIAGAAAADTRNIVGGAIKNRVSASLTKGMTPEQAGQVILYNDALKQTQAAAVNGPASSQQAAMTLKKNLSNAVGDYASNAKAGGLIDRDGRADIMTAQSQANAHNNSLSGVPGGAYEGVQNLPLPADHAQALQSALTQLDYASPQGFAKNASGPATILAQKAAPLIGYGTALLSLAHGNPLGAIGDIGAAAAGHTAPAAAVAGTIGRGLDHLMGTAMTPAEAQLRGAQQVVAKSGYQVPIQQPLNALAQATAETKDPFLLAQKQFEQSGGMQGSPMENTPRASMAPNGGAPAPSPAPGPQAPPQQPPQAPPAAPEQAPATPLPAQPQAPPTGLQGPPTGVQSLAQMMFKDYHPQQGAPLPGEMSTAINSLAQQGVLSEQHAAVANAGMMGANPNEARMIAAHISNHVAGQRGLPSTLMSRPAVDPAAQAGQASSDVQAAMSGQPNGGPRGPIENMARWQGAKSTYQTHASNMGMLAGSSAEKQAISQIATEPTAAGKASILQSYTAANPGVDLSRFTPQLMKGI